MSRFSPFSFIDDRLANLPINDSDKKNFELYNVQRYLSTDKRLSNIVCNFNTTYYHALPKDIQAMAMTAFKEKKFPSMRQEACQIPRRSKSGVLLVTAPVFCTKTRQTASCRTKTGSARLLSKSAATGVTKHRQGPSEQG